MKRPLLLLLLLVVVMRLFTGARGTAFVAPLQSSELDLTGGYRRVGGRVVKEVALKTLA